MSAVDLERLPAEIAALRNIRHLPAEAFADRTDDELGRAFHWLWAARRDCTEGALAIARHLAKRPTERGHTMLITRLRAGRPGSKEPLEIRTGLDADGRMLIVEVESGTGEVFDDDDLTRCLGPDEAREWAAALNFFADEADLRRQGR